MLTASFAKRVLKIKMFIVHSSKILHTALLRAKGSRLRAEGSKLRAKGSDVDLTKRSGGRTLITQKLIGILLLSMKAEDWTLLDGQALGVVRLSLVKNVAYNVVKEKTTYRLIKALSNM
ncbi:hypothetical protein Tco_1089374 [Tanacetum coccineum]